MNIKLIDFNNVFISNTLKILLKDQSTKKNIIWATDNYNVLDEQLENNNQITENLLKNSNIIQPRVLKRIEEQTIRTRKKAEVFTPAWLCNQMNNLCDSEWFGYDNVFNKVENNSWIVNKEKVQFPSKKKWEKYIDSRRLEITCGEAPYIVSRYDASTGELIDIENRIGMLDRKIRIVSENTDTEEDWLKWTIRAFESVYGYEYQGDSLLVARVNLLMTFIEYLDFYWHRKPTYKELSKIVNIISWNFFQMNGLNGNVPMGKYEDTYMQLTFDDLFGLTTEKNNQLIVKAKTYNWRGGNSILFSSISEEVERNMKFDYVIGNPPYQISDGGAQASAKPIYNLFIEQTKKLNPNYISLIIPARWYAGGKGLDNFRTTMLKDTRIKILHDYINANDCFPNVEIKGGVCYFLWDKNHKGNCKVSTHEKNKIISEMIRPLLEKDCDIFIRQNEAVEILHKTKDDNMVSINNIISARKPFAFPTNYADFLDYSNEEYCIKLYANHKIGYVKKDMIIKNQEWLDKWKVYVPEGIGSGETKTDKVNPILGEPNTCCTETYLVIGPFDKKEEAENVISYINTKFFHFLLGIKKITQHTTSKVYSFVPMLDFSQSWSDEKLYKKYNLTTNEVEFIESAVWGNKKG